MLKHERPRTSAETTSPRVRSAPDRAPADMSLAGRVRALQGVAGNQAAHRMVQRERLRTRPTGPLQQSTAGRGPARPDPAGSTDRDPPAPGHERWVQRAAAAAAASEDPDSVLAAARRGTAGPGGPLPHLERIQASFGRFDVAAIVAHTDQAARQGARAMGAEAFASGSHVAFVAPPSLHTAAHEAAHVVQQRAGVQLAGGVGEVGDRYERHADAVADQVVRGEPAEALLAQLAGPAVASTGVVVQRNVALDVIGEGAGDFVASYQRELTKWSALPAHILGALRDLLPCLLDFGLRHWFGLQALIDWLNPYLPILRFVKSVLGAIPEPIRVLMAYALGRGMFWLSEAYAGGTLTEARISALLSGGATTMSWIGTILDGLDAICNNPYTAVITLGKLVWSLCSAGAEPDPARLDEAQEMGQGEGPAPMIDTNLGWCWLSASTPRIATWNSRNATRGGLELDARLGVKLFDNVMGTDKLSVRVAFNGDVDASFSDVSLLSRPITLGDLFRVESIRLPKVRIRQSGLTFLRLLISGLSFGRDVFKANRLELLYRRNDASAGLLRLKGDATLKAFEHQLTGKFALSFDTTGAFAGGEADIVCPETFTLLKDRLTLRNPRATAKWGKERETDLSIGGDLNVALTDRLKFASSGTTIRYTSGEGFRGEVDRIWLNLPISKGGVLRFELTRGKIDSKGFHAGEVALIYAYGEADVAKNSDPDDPSGTSLPEPGSKLDESELEQLAPGFDVAWIKTAGLQTLVVKLGARDVDIDSRGLNVAQLRKEITRVKAHLFGVAAEFDGVARRGKLAGKVSKKIDIPAIMAKFPICPGVHANFGFRTGVSFGAELAAGLTRLDADEGTPDLHPWRLDGTADLSAEGKLQIEAGLGVGIPYLAEVSGNVFGRADGRVALDARLAGKVLWNDATHELLVPPRLEDQPSAELTGTTRMDAKIGASVRAQLFYIVDTELWSYRFVSWDLGEWRFCAALRPTADGGYEVIRTATGFGGEAGAPTTKPIVEKTRVNAAAVIDHHVEKKQKIDSPRKIWRLVHDLQDPGNTMPRLEKLAYYEKLKRINDTGQDLDDIAMQVLRFVDLRSDEGSLLMAGGEWLTYSATGKGLGAEETKRKSIRPIDDAVFAYHNEPRLFERQAILRELIERLIPAYTRQFAVSRKDMAEKLLTDAKRELARIGG